MNRLNKPTSISAALLLASTISAFSADTYTNPIIDENGMLHGEASRGVAQPAPVMDASTAVLSPKQIGTKNSGDNLSAEYILFNGRTIRLLNKAVGTAHSMKRSNHVWKFINPHSCRNFIICR
jgi:hypothetical protein